MDAVVNFRKKKKHKENGLGTIDVRHDQCHTAFKVLFGHVVGHSKPASVSNKTPFKPPRVCGTALVPGNTLQVFVPAALVRGRNKPK